MAMTLLWAGPEDPAATLVIGHSAGAPMDSAWMNAMCALLADRGVRTARFEFAFMASRREGHRRPPTKAENAVGEYRDAVEAVVEIAGSPVLIGGKSYGGRVASLAADELHATGTVSGLVCLGYPFHPPERPEQLRTAHLLTLQTPALICQGTRDPFGGADEVPGFGLPARIEVRWFDGAHDVQPANRLAPVADAVAAFARPLVE
ncbi:MAG: alpha/beta family hydrolase [Pseudolysinimonas sp.]